MDPKNNFINSRPSIITSNEAERADDLSTTDDELELGESNTVLKANRKEEKLIKKTIDKKEEDSIDPGADEET
jgi:hypothetical protein